MAANTVGINSTFEQQRLVINKISQDLDNLFQNPIFNNNVGIGTTNPTSTLTVEGDSYISGVTTSFGGFTSGIGVTNPVKITVTENILTFTVVGVGSTSLILY